MGYFWDTFGVLLGHFLSTFGALLEYVWSTFGGTFAWYIWSIFGLLFDFFYIFWNTFGLPAVVLTTKIEFSSKKFDKCTLGQRFFKFGKHSLRKTEGKSVTDSRYAYVTQ